MKNSSCPSQAISCCIALISDHDTLWNFHERFTTLENLMGCAHAPKHACINVCIAKVTSNKEDIINLQVLALLSTLSKRCLFCSLVLHSGGSSYILYIFWCHFLSSHTFAIIITVSSQFPPVHHLLHAHNRGATLEKRQRNKLFLLM